MEQDVFRELAGHQSLYSFEYDNFWSPIKRPMFVFFQFLEKKKNVLTLEFSDSLRVTQMLLENNIPEIREEHKKCVTGKVLIHPTASVHPTAKV